MAQALILAGCVIVGDRTVDKVGIPIATDAPIRLRRGAKSSPYVSRGGIKLKAALDHFAIPIAGMIAADVGASTGGFTDCLLQAGARKVYAIDVGYGQLAWSLRQTAVVVMERTNIRKLKDIRGITESLDLVVIDVSFISLRLVIPTVKRFLTSGGRLLALVKPQFEAAKGEVADGGVVRDPTVHERVLTHLATYCEEQGLSIVGQCPSPITGPAGNREWFLLARKEAR